MRALKKLFKRKKPSSASRPSSSSLSTRGSQPLQTTKKLEVAETNALGAITTANSDKNAQASDKKNANRKGVVGAREVSAARANPDVRGRRAEEPSSGATSSLAPPRTTATASTVTATSPSNTATKPSTVTPNSTATTATDSRAPSPPAAMSHSTPAKTAPSEGEGYRFRRDSFAQSDVAERELIGDVLDHPRVGKAYDAIPVLEQTKLPRGGISIETKAIGRVQFGIPPETIKDSMRLGIPVPQVYIVPVERFCREMGPALGVNLAEFEFPAYFNFFVYKKRCTLVVDSEEAEDNIRRVFSETLLGPAQFRRENPKPYEEEDFAPDFPRQAIPNFPKELKHFRIMPDGKELVLETLLNFYHFEQPGEAGIHKNLGVPPKIDGDDDDGDDEAAVNAAIAAMVGEEDDVQEEAVPNDETGVEDREKTPWTFSQTRIIGDVATIWPENATPEERKARSVPRVEIFKMPGGTEYIVHDIDENNIIIGKARFAGHVKVAERMSVDGFGGKSFIDELKGKSNTGLLTTLERNDSTDSSNSLVGYVDERIPPPTFHPPSFGVTVLGNSHGFDKSGSVSGYVLWINGRGVMIDPPPYSSATLEKEGIRPRTIVGIILTHCHADHDAGAFQKVLTGSPVVVITTPTIYKSFIRKYAALSALSPALLRHSHRHKPAIIGQPLRFQGATFHFTYTLHTIPCVGFRVEWRGRSMVFTGDHFNSPPAIDKLEETGVLSKARADDLRNLPLQETDLLLHEAGAPPIHTPLEVLLKLPQRVKKRLYVVHTSALPEDCELKAAPTGTPDTLRLDQLSDTKDSLHTGSKRSSTGSMGDIPIPEEEVFIESQWGSASTEYTSTRSMAEIELEKPNNDTVTSMMSSFAHLGAGPGSKGARRHSQWSVDSFPPVALRPASSTDAWFILNLLSAVPFLSSLSYNSTMEVLETAKVDAYCMKDVVMPAARRSQFLCVVWEGTCVEKEKGDARRPSPRLSPVIEKSKKATDKPKKAKEQAVWHAGDWTGPLALQPDKRLSGESENSGTHDVVAMSKEGVKVITVEFSSLHAILKSGSNLYRKYLERRQRQVKRKESIQLSPTAGLTASEKLLNAALQHLNVLELINCNSAMRKFSAVQKRHLECLAEGPVAFGPGERLWRTGAPVDKAFIIVSGTASFVPKRRNAGSAVGTSGGKSPGAARGRGNQAGDSDIGDAMLVDSRQAIKELGPESTLEQHEDSSISSAEVDLLSKGKQIQFESNFQRPSGQEVPTSLTDAHDFAKLSRGLQKRADLLKDGSAHKSSGDMDDHGDEASDGGTEAFDYSFGETESATDSTDRRSFLAKRQSSRARFANKVLGRLYSRRAFTGGLVFSRGHFLGDVSKMVAGLLSGDREEEEEEDFPEYGFGDTKEGLAERSGSATEDMLSVSANMGAIHEEEGDIQVVHSSTLTAGKDGCVALVFPKSRLIPFLDEYPGLLLSLLGTQVVV